VTAGGRRSGRDLKRWTTPDLRFGFDLAEDFPLAAVEDLPLAVAEELDSPQPQATAGSTIAMLTASETRRTRTIVVSLSAGTTDSVQDATSTVRPETAGFPGSTATPTDWRAYSPISTLSI
jgi:hypothetical protein